MEAPAAEDPPAEKGPAAADPHDEKQEWDEYLAVQPQEEWDEWTSSESGTSTSHPDETPLGWPGCPQALSPVALHAKGIEFHDGAPDEAILTAMLISAASRVTAIRCLRGLIAEGLIAEACKGDKGGKGGMGAQEEATQFLQGARLHESALTSLWLALRVADVAAWRAAVQLGEAAGLSDTELAWWTQARELACRCL